MRLPDGISVLLVEDDLDLRWIMQVVLEDAGARVSSCGSAADALSLVREVAPVVVLLDAHLPDGTGSGLAARLALAAPGARCVLVSADLDRVGAWTRQGRLALGKPFEVDELIEVVAHAAGTRAVA